MQQSSSSSLEKISFLYSSLHAKAIVSQAAAFAPPWLHCGGIAAARLPQPSLNASLPLRSLAESYGRRKAAAAAASRRYACIAIGHCCVPLLCALFGAAAHRIFMGSNLPQFPGPNELGTNDRTQFTAGRLYMLRIVASSCCPLFLQADPLQPPPHCQSAWPRGAAVLNCRHCCRSSALGSGVGQGAVPASR